MKKSLLLIISLAGGSVLGLLAYYVHSAVFCLLPLLAFAIGYFSSWELGLTRGLMLFLSYTIAPMLISAPVGDSHPIFYGILHCLFAFILGGFAIPGICTLASLVRKGVRKPAAIMVLVILALLVSYCGYLVFTPTYSYLYQVKVRSSEEVDGLELYMPVGTVSGEPYLELFDYVQDANPKAEYYSVSLVDTEHGRMLKMIVRLLDYSRHSEIPYHGIIIFHNFNAPHEALVLVPKYEGGEVKIPLMVNSSSEVDISISLSIHNSRIDYINFSSLYFMKRDGLWETYEYEGKTGDYWVLVPRKN